MAERGPGRMTKRTFCIAVAGLYVTGLAVALVVLSGQHKIPADAAGWIAFLALPIVWGAYSVVLALVWLTIKRWDYTSARLGLSVFAALYLLLLALRVYSGEPL